MLDPPPSGPEDLGSVAVDRSPVVVLDDVKTAGTTDLSPSGRAHLAAVADRAVLVGVLRGEAPAPGLLDLLDVTLAPSGSPAALMPGVVASDDLERDVGVLLATGQRSPQATWALARLLRLTTVLPAEAGVVAESATYSTLLAGDEFRQWLGARQRGERAPDHDEPRLRVERVADLLEITLTRARRRNAYDARMRDALLEALEVAGLEPGLKVSVRGEGRDFCAGGDLDEFGTASDPALAHRLRVSAHPGLAIERLRARVTAHLHGNCVGSGIEIAAFAGTVLAARDTMLTLPELGMGLVPGAGGTVSLTRRIGRHRVLWWAMSGARIGADTALDWGLLDRVGD